MSCSDCNPVHGKRQYFVSLESSWVRVWATSEDDAILEADALPFGDWEYNFNSSEPIYKVVKDE